MQADATQEQSEDAEEQYLDKVIQENKIEQLDIEYETMQRET